MVAVARDITERRHLEDQLRQAQKMEAVGRLAGGLAHDFNNLLTAVTGYAEILVNRLEPGDRNRKELEQILKAGQRATSLTQQLLAFSRRQRLEPKVLDLNAIVADLEKMLRRLIGEDIDLTVALAPDLGCVEADPSQVGQVLMNLVVNARDAMPRGGKLTIATANREVAEADARVDLAVGSYVTLAVGDTGCGMDAETKARIFEPFFTTKSADNGTGLGLSMVYGVVKQTGGHIVAESEVGAGTTFTIYLPRVHVSNEEAQEPDVSAEPLQGSETVLLVEDERIVRDLAATMLRNRGYRVVEATSGSHALEVARNHDGPLHLLVTDVVMPGMSGCELADRIVAARPGIRLLYMSGYASDATAHHGMVDTHSAFLRKPFTPRALATRVRAALDEPS
jgi:nitrogen-specific signal transduction histidine kinase/CheY-like chemotaxis protein